MKIHFTKMHGLGNDFIVIEDLDGKLGIGPKEAVFLCDRKFGVGADGVLIIGHSEKADLKMKVFNSDGSEAEMCGNGIRCFALYAKEKGLVSGDSFAVETPAGIIKPEIKGEEVEVDMGEPVLEGPRIPINLEGQVIDHPASFGGNNFRITCVSMGNPHCIIFREGGGEVDLEGLGPMIENDVLFPRRTNVEFVRVIGPDEIEVKVWERGAGPTLACGTGACASLVASVLNSKTGREATVRLPGGDLKVEWREEDNRVYMTGPAAFVFSGEITLPGTE